MRPTGTALLIVLLSSGAPGVLPLEGAETTWDRVPASARDRVNPYAQSSSAAQAGRKLYARHCESCHGEDGAGSARAPSLNSDAMHRAAPGEIEWVLRNGSMGRGMPSWSALPEQRRWQIVSYLKSLDGG